MGREEEGRECTDLERRDSGESQAQLTASGRERGKRKNGQETEGREHS